jgi:glycosyltransferase involved in cell wall biosynthesis
MKIVHAVYSLEMGGAEVLVAQLCRIQRAQGHDVSVCAYSELGVIGEKLQSEGIPIQVLGKAHPLLTMWRYLHIFNRMRPDVVHCHNVAPTLQAALPARLADVRRVITTRHRLELFPYDRAAEARYNAFGWLCHWVTGICEVTCENMRRGWFANHKKIVLVYNGTEPVPLVDSKSPEALEKSGFTLLFVGRLVREKDLGTLLRALAIAKHTIAGVTLWIVGDGNSRPELETLSRTLDLGDAVHFWGLQTDTPRFFSAADAFTMSSISEGLPMSLLQSMSLGTPSILTDVDGMGEVLRLTGSGLLVPVGDPVSYADAIVRVATDDDFRHQLSRLAFKAYQERFNLEAMARGYMDLYTDKTKP